MQKFRAVDVDAVAPSLMDQSLQLQAHLGASLWLEPMRRCLCSLPITCSRRLRSFEVHQGSKADRAVPNQKARLRFRTSSAWLLHSESPDRFTGSPVTATTQDSYAQIEKCLITLPLLFNTIERSFTAEQLQEVFSQMDVAGANSHNCHNSWPQTQICALLGRLLSQQNLTWLSTASVTSAMLSSNSLYLALFHL